MKAPVPSARIRAAAALATLLALAGCLLQGGGSGNGPEGSGVRGRFVDSAGHPLVDVRVEALPKDAFRLAKAAASASGTDARTVRTDASGEYALADLPPGEYNLVGVHGEGELAVLVPDVDYRDSTGLLELGEDTLRASATIAGRVLWGGRGREGALVYLPGTSFLAMSGPDGTFLATGIPAGRYIVRYLVPGFQATADSGVMVLAGKVTRLPDKVIAYDTALEPPAPNAPRARFDSARSVVRLEWDRVDVKDILGYLLYRDTGGTSSPILLTPGIHPDTAYADTLPEAFWGGRESAEVVYRLRSIDKDKNSSLGFSPPAAVRAVRRLQVATELTLEFAGQFDNSVRTGSVRVTARYANRLRSVREIAWRTAAEPPQWERIPVSGRDGSIVRDFTWMRPGLQIVAVEAVDSLGDTSRAEAAIQVVEGRPLAEAGRDTAVSPGDTVRLMGWDMDAFGAVARREWDIGVAGGLLPAPDGAAIFTAPSDTGPVACIYRVFDDDGLAAEDTLTVSVIADAPEAHVDGPENVFQGDTVWLSGARSTDGFGRVVAWEWDVGDSGRFVKSSGPDFRFVAGLADTSLVCVLRATDDDGQSSLARFRLGVRTPTAWIRTTGEAPFKSTGDIHAWVFDDRLWVATTMDFTNEGTAVYGLWNSRDLRTWTPAAFDSIQGPASMTVVASESRLWGVMPGMYGGLSTLLTSADARQWQPLSAPEPFWERYFTANAVLGGNVFFLGPVVDNLGAAQEVWGIRNGTEAVRLTDRAAYGKRGYMSATAQGGKLWIYGGNQDTRNMNDLWSSPDGIAWTRVADSVLPRARSGAQLVSHGGELWLMGGVDPTDDLAERPWDILRSRDGVRWTRDPVEFPAIRSRSYTYKVVEFRGRLCLVALLWDNFGRFTKAEVWAAP